VFLDENAKNMAIFAFWCCFLKKKGYVVNRCGEFSLRKKE
jgi:hypothetical protein